MDEKDALYESELAERDEKIVATGRPAVCHVSHLTVPLAERKLTKAETEAKLNDHVLQVHCHALSSDLSHSMPMCKDMASVLNCHPTKSAICAAIDAGKIERKHLHAAFGPGGQVRIAFDPCHMSH